MTTNLETVLVFFSVELVLDHYVFAITACSDVFNLATIDKGFIKGSVTTLCYRLPGLCLLTIASFPKFPELLWSVLQHL